MKNRIKISVDGKSFTLVGEETEEHMRAVSAYIDDKIKEVRKSGVAVRMDTSLAYVLAGLNVADDYFKEKEKRAEMEGRNLGLSTRLEQLIPQLDETKKELEEMKAKLAELQEKVPQAQEQAIISSTEGKKEQVEEKEEDQHSQEMQLKHYPMGLKGGQAEKAMVRNVIREKYRKK